jgi:iron complex outermembrane receptor protein
VATPVAFSLLALLAALPASRLRAADPAPAAPTDDQVVVLSPFAVSSTHSAHYQADESISGGRIRTSIMDSASSIAVITRDLVNDVSAGRTMDAVKYVAGVTESTIPGTLDRTTIRGFQTDGYTLDGFYYSDSQSNYDPSTVDRLEVVKGPNALLSPTGVPGGTINIVSKKPQFTQSGYVTAQVGQYNDTRGELDVTGPIPGTNFAYRLVGALNYDNSLYLDSTYRHGYLIDPSLTYRFSPDVQVTIQGDIERQVQSNVNGIPASGSSGTNTGFSFLPGLSRTYNYMALEPNNLRTDIRYALWMLATAKVTDHVSMRLSGRISQQVPKTVTIQPGVTTGGSYNPLSGVWTPGTAFGPAPTFTPSPLATVAGLTFPTGGTYNAQRHDRRDLQNDYLLDYDLKWFHTVTTLGFAYDYNLAQTVVRNITGHATGPYSPATVPATYAAINTNTRAQNTYTQPYVMEDLSAFKDRLILNVGIANYTFTADTVNRAAATPTLYEIDGSKNTITYGAVLKPVEFISLFYGYTENAVPVANIDQVVLNGIPSLSQGKQKEGGIKFQLLDKRLIGSITRYEIVQTNYSVPNPLNQTVPPPAVLLPNLYANRRALGWEYQVTAAVTPELSVIANYTSFTNRDPNNIPFRGTPEKSGALYVRYDFKSGLLNNFGAGIGAVYTARRPGDAASGLTAASTPTNPIPNQPSFYLPSMTLVSLNLSYTWWRTTFKFNVDNLTNLSYAAASLSRQTIYPGLPRNYSGSVTYKF